MKLRNKIASGLLVLLVLAVAGLAVTVRYTAACGDAPAAAFDGPAMQAIRHDCYGSPDVLRLERVPRPVPAEDGLLVRVRAASVNPLDWHYLRGSPYLMRLGTGLGAPTDQRLGVDFAGTVEAVGPAVRQFRPGDAVFGGAGGAFGEYVTVREAGSVARIPEGVGFEQAATLPIAAVTALQALRDDGGLQAGEKVLINGASGGVGTFAVQIAKALGAEVTGVSSTRNLELVRSLGADDMVDYTKEDYTRGSRRFDLIVDLVGNHSPSAHRRALTPTGRLVIVGGGAGDWLGPFWNPLKAVVLSLFVDQTLKPMLARIDPDGLATLAEMVASGQVTPVIDRRYPLAEVPAAIRYSEEGRARGKIIVTVE
jgi:NADPH:quinone reductase-like Zn-dependent oxidoreductase